MKEYLSLFLKDKELKPSSGRLLSFLVLIGIYITIYCGFRFDPKYHKFALGVVETLSYILMATVFASQGSKAVESLKTSENLAKEVTQNVVASNTASTGNDQSPSPSRFIK